MKLPKNRRKKPLFEGSDWTISKVREGWDIINAIAQEKYGWEGYPVQFEIVSSSQLLDVYVHAGMPTFYSHWSFGKDRLELEKDYRNHRSLAYEMIINTNPSICYINEDNDMMMQLLVTAHAAVGHNHFFKHNYLYREWTQPDFIVDFLTYAKKYIAKCEAEYGTTLVSQILDIAHLLKPFSVFKSKQTDKSKLEREEKVNNQVKDIYQSYDPLLDHDFKSYKRLKFVSHIPKYNESENLLYFLETQDKNLTTLTDWQREIFSIVRTTQQYFYPNYQTKMMNEGFASFAHYTLMHDLYDLGYISEGYMLEFLDSHCGVCNQYDFHKDKPHTWGINPYALGFNIMQDIKRICENPTEEDKKAIPYYAGSNWIETMNHAVSNYRDESLISEFLTPALIRKMKLFSINTKRSDKEYRINAIQQEADYSTIRDKLALQYSWHRMFPDIEIRTTSTGIKEIEDLKKATAIYFIPIDEVEETLYIRLKDIQSNEFENEGLTVLYLYIKKIWKGKISIEVFDNQNLLLQRVNGRV